MRTCWKALGSHRRTRGPSRRGFHKPKAENLSLTKLKLIKYVQIPAFKVMGARGGVFQRTQENQLITLKMSKPRERPRQAPDDAPSPNAGPHY